MSKWIRWIRRISKKITWIRWISNFPKPSVNMPLSGWKRKLCPKKCGDKLFLKKNKYEVLLDALTCMYKTSLNILKKKKKKKKKMLTSFTPYAGGGGLIKTFYLIHCCVIELMHPKFSGIPLILPVNKQWFFKKVWSVFSMRQYSSLLEFRVYLGRDLAYQFHYSKVCSPWHLFCSPDHQCKFATQMANLRPEWYSSYSLLCD